MARRWRCIGSRGGNSVIHFIGVYCLKATGEQAQTAKRRAEQAASAAIPEPHLLRFELGDLRIYADARHAAHGRSGVAGCVVAGDMLLDGCDSAGRDNDALLRTVDRSGMAGLGEKLYSARGNFAGIVWDERNKQATLFADFLGTYPIYYCQAHGAVWFSTRLAALRDALPAPAPLDAEGIATHCAFGYSLDDLTPYSGISTLGPAAMLSLLPAGPSASAYWDWKTCPIDESPNLGALADAALAAFTDAVKMRAARTDTAIALLSGGMDSRMIVAVLRALGKPVVTVNFSHRQSLDFDLSKRFAEVAKTDHRRFEIDSAAFEAHGGTAGIVGRQVLPRLDVPSAGAIRVWSGDGGSIGLGGVNVTDDMLAASASGDHGEAARLLVAGVKIGLSKGLFNKSIAGHDFCRARVEDRLRAMAAPRQDLRPYLFLLGNDQRRHLHYHYELQHDRPFDFFTPFWDPVFMRTVMRCPARELSYHRFYSLVFDRLPPSARAVPWQTYPGHAPCPLPLPAGRDYQWTTAPRDGDRRYRRTIGLDAVKSLLRGRFPRRMIRPFSALAACLALICNIRNTWHIVSQLGQVLRYSDQRTRP